MVKESADNHIDRTNVEFLQFFNLTLSDLVETNSIDSEVIFNVWDDELTEEDNLAAIDIKIYCMFGDEEAADFQRAVRELSHGTIREKIKFLLAERVRCGDKAWEDILSREALRRQMLRAGRQTCGMWLSATL
jgi:hypothetical protein